MQRKSLPFRLTVFDAVLLGRKPHMGWRVSAQDPQIVDAAIKRLHLKQLSMHYINRISSGELQKVCIARALVQKPKVLLLDEPTAGLDLHNQLEITRAVRMVVEQHPVGVVMTMHDLNLALRGYRAQSCFLSLLFSGVQRSLDFSHAPATQSQLRVGIITGNRQTGITRQITL